jgi:protein-disulfide isomerase
VTLVEFTDYQCPFCKRFRERSWPELKAKYVDTGKVRLVVRNLPLSFHSQALPAAIAARCAGEQGRFAAVSDALFAAPQLSAESIRAIVAAAGVAAPAFERCTANAAIRQGIDADTAEAERLGINGTPGFVVAQKTGGKLEGTLIVGAQPTSVFSARLDALLGAPPVN